jgi:site-specific recombinase XerD
MTKTMRDGGGSFSGYDIRKLQDVLGHIDVKTIMIYTHVLVSTRPVCPTSHL